MPDKITATAASAANMQSQAGTSAQVPAAESVVMPATVFSFGPEDSEPVGAAKDFGEDTQTGETAPEEGQDNAPGDELNGKPQKEIGAYWRKERERRDREIEKAKQEFEIKLGSDPIRQLGQLMIDNIVAREGKTPDEAAKIAEERFIAAYAKQEGMTPAQARLDLVAKRLLSANTPLSANAPDKPGPQKPAEQPAALDDIEAEAEAQAAEIVEELSAMRLPGGFDLGSAMQDQTFQDLLIDYGPKAAVRIYAAEQTARQAPQQIADKLRARQQIPQAMRPQQAVSPEPSYRDMSSEEFFAEKERLLKKINR